jgi:CheY-like chemotaxis protein
VDQQRLILVVEDDDATRAFLLDNLAADGFRVAGASGVGEGLRAIEVRQPALVVLDLLLEDGSGLHLLDRVRAADGLASRIDPELPVIVLTGRAGEADRVRSFARGADDHLSKPTCRFPQHAIPVVHRARDPVGRLASSTAGTRRVRQEMRRPHSVTPMVPAVDTTRPSSGLIIRLTGRNTRRPPPARATNCLLSRGKPRPALSARDCCCLVLVDHPSTIEAGPNLRGRL